MSQAAQAHDSWTDIPPRRPRREPVSWASAEDLEILGGLGEQRSADWTVLTLERDASPADDRAGGPGVVVDLHDDWDHDGRAAAAPRRSRPAARERFATEPEADTESMAVPMASRAAGSSRDRMARTEPAYDEGRRTVVIRGHATPMRMDAGADRRRPAPRTRDRIGHRPDRVAMWAVMLGLLLIVVATMTAG